MMTLKGRFEINSPLVKKSAEMGEARVKNTEKRPTLFMDGPFSDFNQFFDPLS